MAKAQIESTCPTVKVLLEVGDVLYVNVPYGTIGRGKYEVKRVTASKAFTSGGYVADRNLYNYGAGDFAPLKANAGDKSYTAAKLETPLLKAQYDYVEAIDKVLGKLAEIQAGVSVMSTEDLNRLLYNLNQL